MKTQAIIPAAGSGQRLQSETPKPFVLIKKKPLFIHTLEIFDRVAEIDNVILVVAKNLKSSYERYLKKYKIKKIKYVVDGGRTRQESVSCGLSALEADTDVVLIHDAARPLISLNLIRAALLDIKKENAVIIGVPVKSTIKRVNSDDSYVKETLDRAQLWEIQTPQVFKKDILLKAHRSNICPHPTDDAMMVEALGVKVKVLLGDEQNFKITTKEDLERFRNFL